MNIDSWKRRLVFFALVGAWLALGDAPTSAVSRDSHVCSEQCDETAGCSQECWLTQFEFDNDYPSTTCGDEGYECCGDEVCNAGPEGCNVCTDDCSGVAECDVECWDISDCDPDEQVCSPAHLCVDRPDPGDFPSGSGCATSCTGNGECCGSEVCIGNPGQKYCGIPSPSYCESAHECYSANDCQGWADGLCNANYGGHGDMFCDPGIDSSQTGRCQFVTGPGCPEDKWSACNNPH